MVAEEATPQALPTGEELTERIAEEAGYQVEIVPIGSLSPHPENYKTHPDDQLEHLAQSIREHGVYRNVVVARDGTILAGHGVVLALRRLGVTRVPVKRLDLGPLDARAKKVLAADNEIAHLGIVDDRKLAELLREIAHEDPVGLPGTGYDEAMLANLLYVTRPAHEIADHAEAAQWVGLPGYEESADPLKLVVSFRNEQDRAAFLDRLGVELADTSKSMWWPPKAREDLNSVIFE